MTEHKILLKNYEAKIIRADNKMVINIKNIISTDEYYVEFKDDDNIKNIAPFITDIPSLNNFLAEQFNEYLRDETNKTTDIMLDIEETKQYLILHFETRKHIKYMKIAFNITLNRREISFEEYAKNMMTIMNSKIMKLENEIERSQLQNKRLSELICCNRSDIDLVNQKMGNIIFIRNCGPFSINDQYLRLNENTKKSALSYDDASAVHKLDIMQATENDLMVIGNLKKLQNFEIKDNINITSLNFLIGCDEILHIEIKDCENLVDVIALSNIQTIQTIKIINCKNLSDISPLSNLKNLEKLVISGTSVKDFTVFKNNKQLKISDGAKILY